MFYYVVRRLEKYPNNKNMDFVKILPTTTVFKEKMTIFFHVFAINYITNANNNKKCTLANVAHHRKQSSKMSKIFYTNARTNFTETPGSQCIKTLVPGKISFSPEAE